MLRSTLRQIELGRAGHDSNLLGSFLDGDLDLIGLFQTLFD